MICLAGVRIEMNTEFNPDPTQTVIKVDVTPTGTGGMAASTETRKMDWAPFEKNDFLFGLCQERSEFVRGSKDDQGREYPSVDMQTEVGDLRAGRFLRGEINEHGSETEWDVSRQVLGDEKKGEEGNESVWVHTFVRNLNGGNGWTAEQIWGFEIIDGERCHTRRVVVANKKGQYVLARLVYKYLADGTGSKG
ncbi:uncharacterized protein DSM5745_09506 [Aspergillus mulundensis]|uniref:Uncharacterized protein n=1 Tax=Aspergillus mulundensis TaxID=1810919 RepID=A0A3D8QVG7_9EURO|nr:Uncharacterized protein DSM5745_09506 [Aspergillus mulundensis]RDW65767.1 Uncharacterized protein DSM5745_09506 [Aspergillus mulundensis]